MLAQLRNVVSSARESLETYNHMRALEEIETFFWGFCDNYVELVKGRAYAAPGAGNAGETVAPGAVNLGDAAGSASGAVNLGDAAGSASGANVTSGAGTPGASARNALATALHTLLRLLAPYIPYSTEEAWSWFDYEDKSSSVHRADYPTISELDAFKNEDTSIYDLATVALGALRGIKSKEKVSMRTQLKSVTLGVQPNTKDLIQKSTPDLLTAACIIGDFNIIEQEAPSSNTQSGKIQDDNTQGNEAQGDKTQIDQESQLKVIDFVLDME
jgi:valyl-tRNA synthetase